MPYPFFLFPALTREVRFYTPNKEKTNESAALHTRSAHPCKVLIALGLVAWPGGRELELKSCFPFDCHVTSEFLRHPAGDIEWTTLPAFLPRSATKGCW